jgi:hypothetical protein
MDPMHLLGTVSTEGGPILIADFEAASKWSGIDGEPSDYERLIGHLEVAGDAPGLQIDLAGIPAIAWQMPTGTAEIWRRGKDSLLISRPWLEEGSHSAAHLAGLPAKNPVRIGTLRIESGWLVVVWATEAGKDFAVAPEEARTLNLSVEKSGLVAGLPHGAYECFHDEVSDGSESTQRCFVLPSGAAPR